ncbi:MAG: hypothetical protein GY871_04480 [Actinomycetales bacterium]|nr:hypothetical protein [Actinomycetales bacterium]
MSGQNWAPLLRSIYVFSLFVPGVAFAAQVTGIAALPLGISGAALLVAAVAYGSHKQRTETLEKRAQAAEDALKELRNKSESELRELRDKAHEVDRQMAANASVEAAIKAMSATLVAAVQASVGGMTVAFEREAARLDDHSTRLREVERQSDQVSSALNDVTRSVGDIEELKRRMRRVEASEE